MVFKPLCLTLGSCILNTMGLKTNMGTIDRGIRLSAALLLGGAVITGQFSGVWFWIMTILAVVFLVTATIRVCPLYLPLGISTKSKKVK